jgi:hypothetical protein
MTQQQQQQQQGAATNEDSAQQVEEGYVIPPGGAQLPGTSEGGDDPDKFLATGERGTRAETWGADTGFGQSDGASGEGEPTMGGSRTADAGTPYHQKDVADPMQMPPPYISRNQDGSAKVDNLAAEDAGHH